MEPKTKQKKVPQFYFVLFFGLCVTSSVVGISPPPPRVYGGFSEDVPCWFLLNKLFSVTGMVYLIRSTQIKGCAIAPVGILFVRFFFFRSWVVLE